MKIIEGHAHIARRDDIDISVDRFRGMMDHFKYDSMHLCMYIHDVLEEETDVTRNVKAMYCKKHLPIYASAGLIHKKEGDTPEDFLAQAKKYIEMGFDGFKMLEGKPGQRKLFGVPLDAPLYHKFYEYAQENNIPIVLHTSDPSFYWDWSRLSDYAKERGWFCDDTYPTWDDFRKEVWGIMEKFPKLHLVLAHMGFLNEVPERAAEFMERWDNTVLDLTPNSYEMLDIAKDFDWWKAFFSKYRKRIVYGTDAYSFDLDGATYDERYMRIRPLQAFLETDDHEINVGVGVVPHGLGLDKDILEDIYYNNFKRLYGEPKPVCNELVAEECNILLENPPYNLLDEDIKNLEKIKTYFTK